MTPISLGGRAAQSNASTYGYAIVSGSEVILDAAAVQELLEGEQGPVMLNMAQRADRVAQWVREHIAVGDPPGVDSHLRDTIVKRFVRDGTGAAIWVGSEHPRMLMYEKGTRPHVILPRNAKLLRFETGDGVVFAAKVNHPGTQATNVLVRGLEAAGG